MHEFVNEKMNMRHNKGQMKTCMKNEHEGMITYTMVNEFQCQNKTKLTTNSKI